jgi:hypothetical protein
MENQIKLPEKIKIVSETITLTIYLKDCRNATEVLSYMKLSSSSKGEYDIVIPYIPKR